MKRGVQFVFILLLILTAAFVFGPREPADTTITFDPARMGDDLVAYLRKTEGAVSAIEPGAEREIVWTDPATRRQTEYSVIYLHGFSATKEEIRPLPDLVAKALGANIYYSRLTGHGQDGDALARATVNDWVNDTVEALAIGRRLGRRVIVISTSTGGSLATWAAAQPELARNIAANVFISPNYGLKATGSQVLHLPWARQIVPYLLGPVREWKPENDEQRRWWTEKYPSVALLPVAAAIDLAFAAEVEMATTPALFVYADGDQVVDPANTRAVAGRWGGAHETIVVSGADDPYQHLIAGRIYSPSATDELAKKIVAWIKRQ